MLTLQFDGLFRGAPQDLHLSDDAGFMCYGWVILRDGMVIARGHGGYVCAQDASSNVAEYLGLIEGIEALLDMRATKELIVICGDAKSVIEQMQGRACVSASSIKPHYRRANKLVHHFHRILWTWTPRRNNHTADSLTRRALRQIRANPEQYENAFQKRRHLIGTHPILDLRMYRTA
jgi:ribonuclease HI